MCGVAGGRRSHNHSTLPSRGVGGLQMFMCVQVLVMLNTHTHINPNIRWNSLDDHSFFFFHIRFIMYSEARYSCFGWQTLPASRCFISKKWRGTLCPPRETSVPFVIAEQSATTSTVHFASQTRPGFCICSPQCPSIIIIIIILLFSFI